MGHRQEASSPYSSYSRDLRLRICYFWHCRVCLDGVSGFINSLASNLATCVSSPQRFLQKCDRFGANTFGIYRSVTFRERTDRLVCKLIYVQVLPVMGYTRAAANRSLKQKKYRKKNAVLYINVREKVYFIIIVNNWKET